MRNWSSAPGTRTVMWLKMSVVIPKWSARRYAAARLTRASHSASEYPFLSPAIPVLLYPLFTGFSNSSPSTRMASTRSLKKQISPATPATSAVGYL